MQWAHAINLKAPMWSTFWGPQNSNSLDQMVPIFCTPVGLREYRRAVPDNNYIPAEQIASVAWVLSTYKARTVKAKTNQSQVLKNFQFDMTCSHFSKKNVGRVFSRKHTSNKSQHVCTVGIEVVKVGPKGYPSLTSLDYTLTLRRYSRELFHSWIMGHEVKSVKHVNTKISGIWRNFLPSLIQGPSSISLAFTEQLN